VPSPRTQAVAPSLVVQALPTEIREQAAAYAIRDAVPWPLLQTVCRALRASEVLPRPWLQDLARSGGLQLPSPPLCVSAVSCSRSLWRRCLRSALVHTGGPATLT